MKMDYLNNTKRLRLLMVFGAALLFMKNVNAQFSVAGPLTGTNSPGPITVNAIYIGRGAYQGNATNTAVGTSALSSTVVTFPGAYSNTAVGYFALRLLPNAKSNAAVGSNAMEFASSANANGNVAVGANALQNSVAPSLNVALGSNAMQSATGNGNAVVGYQSLPSSSGNFNTAIGSQAMLYHTSGDGNVAIGNLAALPTAATGSNQLSIQNVIYGINMTSTGGNVGIGVKPGSGTLAKLEIGGTLKVNQVLNTTNTQGTYLWRGSDNVINESSLSSVLSTLNFWSLTGNTATLPGTGAGQNYLGTTDGQSLVIATNGVRRITILPNNVNGTSGFVGINTALPGAPLEIRHPTNAQDNYLRIVGTAPSIQFVDVNNAANPNIGRIGLASGVNHFLGGAAAGDFIVQSLGTGDLILGAGIFPNGQNNNGFEVMRLTQVLNNGVPTNQGRVGVLTAAPTATLHVVGPVGAASVVRFQNLPLNTQANLPVVVIDAQGNLFRANTTVGNRPAAAPVNNTELENKVDQLQDEIKNLRSLVELMVSAKPNLASSQQFNIYPNPANNNIRIEPNNTGKSNSSQYAEVRDMANRIVVSQILFNKTVNINLGGNLASGTYLVVIYEDDKVIQTEKIQVAK